MNSIFADSPSVREGELAVGSLLSMPSISLTLFGQLNHSFTYIYISYLTCILGTASWGSSYSTTVMGPVAERPLYCLYGPWHGDIASSSIISRFVIYNRLHRRECACSLQTCANRTWLPASSAKQKQLRPSHVIMLSSSSLSSSP